MMSKHFKTTDEVESNFVAILDCKGDESTADDITNTQQQFNPFFTCCSLDPFSLYRLCLARALAGTTKSPC